MSMRVFVTGATGYLGSAIAARLVLARYDVHGLVRSSAGALALEGLGVRPVRGELEDTASWLSELKNSDAVVHAALADAETARRDQQALEAFRAGALDGRVRRLLYTSGVWVHGDTRGQVVDESSALDPATYSAWRPAHEEAAFDLTGHEVKVVVLRPGMVYGERRGTLGKWFREARDLGVVRYPGDGSQRWAMVHRDDVAEAYRLALEHASGGERYLLADESRLTVREMAEAVAQVSGARAHATPSEALLERLGSYGQALLMDQQVSSAKARRELGWVPKHSSFVAEIESIYREWLAGRRVAVE